MPTSFDALHDETRPLRMLESATTVPAAGPGVALASLLLIVLPVLAVVLL